MSHATIIVAAGHNLALPPATVTSYCVVSVSGVEIGQSREVPRTIAPLWNLSVKVDPKYFGSISSFFSFTLLPLSFQKMERAN